MTERAVSFFPDADHDELQMTLRIVADAAFGVVMATCLRREPIDESHMHQVLYELAIAIIRARHR